MASRYWYARSFPGAEVQNTRMAPVSSEGWAVVAFFGGCLIAGAVALFLFSFTYRAPFIGFVTMAVFAVVGLVAFVALVHLKGDKTHTVDEYRAGRVRL